MATLTDPHPDPRIDGAAREIAREITHVGGAGPDEWNALVEINRLRLRPMLRRFHDAAWDAGKKAGAEEALNKLDPYTEHGRECGYESQASETRFVCRCGLLDVEASILPFSPVVLARLGREEGGR